VELFLRFAPDRQEILPAAVKKFRCGKHRIELFHEARGIRFYDDSKGTNPAAVAAAVESVEGKIVLLAGGLDKGMDFSCLKDVAHRIRLGVLYGECRTPIAEVLSSAGVPVCDCGKEFERAVETAINAAVSGDAVMLSPGCASMDMFKNYQERGEKFKELVRKKI
jgi:UDP-N-acetylmuramoylalanine--D-glutamate ligase